MPSFKIIRPKNFVSQIQNSYLSISIGKLASRSFSRISRTYFQYSSKLLLNIIMSLTYTETKLSRYSLRTSLIQDQKVNGVLHSLNGIAKHLNQPYRIVKAIFYLCPSAIRIQLKAPEMSNLVKYFLLTMRLIVSLIKGKGQRFLIVNILRPRKLI